MKILQLIDETWDSGLTAYALQAAGVLKQSGQEIGVGVLSGKTPEAMARHRGLTTFKVEGVLDLLKVLKQHNWDVINAHTGRTHTWSILAKILGGSRLKNIAVVRTRGDARLLKVNPIFRFLYRKTSGVIAASEHVRKQYEEGLRMSEAKVRTIYPGVSIDDPPSRLPSAMVGIIGRLDVVKGHSIFLEAVAQVVKILPYVRFFIAGKEAGVSLQLLQNQVAEMEIDKNVEFLGYVPSATDFMRQCSIGVIASIGSEEVSRACLEWMAAGRPVVGTLVGCLPELIEPEETGLLIPPNDSVAMSEALLRLLREPSLISRWGENGRQMARSKYSPEIFLEKTLAVYQWALEHTRKK